MNKETILYSMRRGRQISVFLDNRPGTLNRLLDPLGEAGINIHALSATEGLDHGYVRLVVDDPDRALERLNEMKQLAYTRDVLLLEIGNRPGVLAAVAEVLGATGVNIEYAYCAGGPALDRGLIVLRVSDVEAAEAALTPHLDGGEPA